MQLQDKIYIILSTKDILKLSYFPQKMYTMGIKSFEKNKILLFIN